MIVVRLLVLALVLAVSAACAGDPGRDADASQKPTVAPRLGGEQTAPAAPPTRPMDRVEEAVAAQLDDELGEQRLSVDYLACPEWRHPSSQHETCRGYVEGVVVDVEVWLHGPADNRVFDARLGSGVLATANLVDRLVAAGYHRVDCGDRPAYPTVVGDRIICAVTRDGRRSYVVATVTSDDGQVAISAY